MLIKSQISDFIGFFVIGMLIAVIFDFFRTFRSLKKVSSTNVILQDIVYFFIATFVIFWGIINVLDSSIRLYIFLAIGLGSVFHFVFFSKYTKKIYIFGFRISKKVFNFFLLPIYLILYIILKNCIIMKKIIKKCCKKFFYVITFILKKLKLKKFSLNFRKTKEGISYEKSI